MHCLGPDLPLEVYETAALSHCCLQTVSKDREVREKFSRLPAVRARFQRSRQAKEQEARHWKKQEQALLAHGQRANLLGGHLSRHTLTDAAHKDVSRNVLTKMQKAYMAGIIFIQTCYRGWSTRRWIRKQFGHRWPAWRELEMEAGEAGKGAAMVELHAVVKPLLSARSNVSAGSGSSSNSSATNNGSIIEEHGREHADRAIAFSRAARGKSMKLDVHRKTNTAEQGGDDKNSGEVR